MGEGELSSGLSGGKAGVSGKLCWNINVVQAMISEKGTEVKGEEAAMKAR